MSALWEGDKRETMTRAKNVLGILVTNTRMKKTKITVRVTVDAIGKSLSLAAEKEGFMLEIALEDVKNLLKENEEAF